MNLRMMEMCVICGKGLLSLHTKVLCVTIDVDSSL